MQVRTTASPKYRVEFMGRVEAKLEVANYEDLVLLEKRLITPDKIRRLIIRGIVDTGSTTLVLPQGVAKQLGLTPKRKVNVEYADDHFKVRDEVEGVYVTLLGRGGIYRAILEPKRDTALISAIILEDLDLLVDCKKLRLVPRDPKYKVFEV